MSDGTEGIAYELGRVTAQPVKSEKTVAAVAEMAQRLVAMGVLVEEDGRGNGWIVIDDLRQRRMPDDLDGYVFADKGHAFLFWWGLGEPDSYRLILECNPRVEAEIVFGEEGVLEIGDAEVRRDPPRLRVVPG